MLVAMIGAFHAAMRRLIKSVLRNNAFVTWRSGGRPYENAHTDLHKDVSERPESVVFKAAPSCRDYGISLSRSWRRQGDGASGRWMKIAIE